jgi:hypothetical protein
MSSATAATSVEEGLPPPPPSSSHQPTTAETTGLLLGSGGTNDDELTQRQQPSRTRLPRLLVRQITGEQTTLRLGLDDTVGALKEALRAEWGIEADAQRLLLAQTAVAAAGGDAEAGESKGGLPLEEDEAATLRACGVVDGAELLLTLQDAAQGAARRELREAARREAAERAEAERELAAERAELSALRGDARQGRRRVLKSRPVAELTEPQREFLSREARMECLRRSAVLVLVLALVAWVVYFETTPCEDGAHLDGWERSRIREGCGDGVTSLDLEYTSVSGDVSGLAPLTQLNYLNLERTSVSGDVSGLAPLTQLTELSLYSTSVSGDVSGLAPLTQLTVLYLYDTSVCGQRDGRDYGTC